MRRATSTEASILATWRMRSYTVSIWGLNRGADRTSGGWSPVDARLPAREARRHAAIPESAALHQFGGLCPAVVVGHHNHGDKRFGDLLEKVNLRFDSTVVRI